MREEERDWDPNSTYMDDPVLSLGFLVLSGQYFPKIKGDHKGDILDPFVEIELFGIEKDCGQKF